MTFLPQILLIAVCMAWEAFFAGIEVGIISIHRMRLRHFVREKEPGAKLLQGFLDHPDRLLGTTLVGTNISVVVVSVVSASIAVELIGAMGETVSTAVMSVLVVVFCEYLPKAWFHARPLDRSRRFVRVLRFWEVLFRPISLVIVWFTRWLVPGPSRPLSRLVPFVTRDDLKILAHEGERDGVLSPKERKMIDRVIELSGKRADQVMVPRADITFVETGTSVRDFFEVARKSGYTRMPVYDRTKDEFVGIVNVFYALAAHVVDLDQPVDEFSRPAIFIPEDMPADDIFPRLRRFRLPMCLVVDPAHRVVGLLTTEDILREIVGPL